MRTAEHDPVCAALTHDDEDSCTCGLFDSTRPRSIRGRWWWPRDGLEWVLALTMVGFIATALGGIVANILEAT